MSKGAVIVLIKKELMFLLLIIRLSLYFKWNHTALCLSIGFSALDEVFKECLKIFRDCHLTLVRGPFSISYFLLLGKESSGKWTHLQSFEIDSLSSSLNVVSFGIYMM